MTQSHFGFKPALFALLASLACAVHAVPVSATDAFSGARITSLQNAGDGTTAPASFDGGQHAFFSERMPRGTIGSISFNTGTAVTLSGIRLYAGHDGPGQGRAMNAFNFFVDEDSDGSYTQLVAQAINPIYGASQAGNAATRSNELELTFMFAGPITSSQWMYEVQQAGSSGAFSGVRVIELDAITAANAVPEPATLALAGLGLVGALVSRRRRPTR